MSAHQDGLSNSDFNRLRDLIYAEVGIHLGTDKKTMLEVRLRRRLSSLRIASYAEYCDSALAPGGAHNELIHLIDAVPPTRPTSFANRTTSSFSPPKPSPS